MKLNQIKKGAKVFWNDPCQCECSGWGVVDSYQSPIEEDSVVCLNMIDGGWVECYPHELSLTEPKKTSKM